MEPLIVPAVIASTQEELDAALASLKGVGDRVMLDVMDGRFVPSRSLDFPFEVPPSRVYEVHLMAADPLPMLGRLRGRVAVAALHVEALGDVSAAVKRCREMGFQVYLALNPDTPLSRATPHLAELDGVLVMTVYPGRYGAPFVPEALGKVRELRRLSPRIRIEVDGAMNPGNARLAREAGADVFASGSFIVKAGDPAEAVRLLREAVR